jgi:hypothetical protein
MFAFLIAVVVLANTAHAVDPAVLGRTENSKVAIDSTFYGNTLGVGYAGLNATVSPFGTLYESGVRFRLSGSWVGYSYNNGDDVNSVTPTTLASGNDLVGSLLLGYGLETKRISAIGLIGISIDQNQAAGIPSTGVGMVGELSVWATPTDMTLVEGLAQYATINQAYYTQLKVGLKALDTSYIGVEGALSGRVIQSETNFAQRSIGGHISNIQIGRAYLGFSAGYVFDDQLGGGAYISSSLYIEF